MQRVGSLEIDQDLDFERREWTVQRVGWVIVLLILVAGLAGLLGPGLLSHVEASNEPLSLEYERFVRKGASTEVHLQLEPGAAREGEIAIWLNQAYLTKVAIDHIVPEPVETQEADDGVIFLFAVENPDQPSEIAFDIMPAEPGMVRGLIGLADGPTMPIDQFIYP